LLLGRKTSTVDSNKRSSRDIAVQHERAVWSPQVMNLVQQPEAATCARGRIFAL